MNKTTLTIFITALTVFLGGGIVMFLMLTNTADRFDGLVKLHEVEILREDLIIRIDQVQSYITRNKIRGSGDVDALNAQVREMNQAVASCLGCHHSPERTQGLLVMRDVSADYEQAITALVASAANTAATSVLERKAQELGRNLLAMTKGMAFAANTGLQHKSRAVVRSLRTARNVYVILFVLALLLAALGMAHLLKATSRRHREALEALGRIQRGDLDHRMRTDTAGGGTVSEIGEAFNAMAECLAVSRRRLEQDARVSGAVGLASSAGKEFDRLVVNMLNDANVLLSLPGLSGEVVAHLNGLKRQLSLCHEKIGAWGERPPDEHAPQTRADVMALVKDAMVYIQHMAKNKGIALVLDCTADLPALEVNRERMRPAFLNIARTMISRMSGGTLTIKCSHGRDCDGRDVVFVDTICISPTVTESVVKGLLMPSFSLAPAEDPEGASLAESYRAVRDQGGYLDVESLPGQGAMVRLILSQKTERIRS